MINTTEHYGLKKPDGEENVDISVLNWNMDKIDELLYDINQRIGPTAYSIPLELSASLFDDAVGTPIISEDSNITNLIVGNTYKITVYDKDNNSYESTGTCIHLDDDGYDDLSFVFEDKTVFPEYIRVLYDSEEVPFVLYNGLNVTTFSEGDGFVFMSNFPEGVTADDAKGAFSKFYIEEATTPPQPTHLTEIESTNLDVSVVGGEYELFYSDSANSLSMSEGNSYKCTVVDVNDNEYVFNPTNSQGIYTEQSYQGHTYGEVQWNNSGDSPTPSFPDNPNPLRLIQYVKITNGASWTISNPDDITWQGFVLEIDTYNAQGIPQSIKAEIKSVVIDEVDNT